MGDKDAKMPHQEEEMKNVVKLLCQQVIQNTYTERQVTYQPAPTPLSPVDQDTDVIELKAEEACELRQRVQTPVSTGLSLMAYSNYRSRKLIDMLSSLHMCDSYNKVIELEKRIEQGLLQQCKELGEDGSPLEYILPGFVKV